jgi:hypothetical protein
MSDFTDFLAVVKEWVGRTDYSDAVTTSFVRMAETTLTLSLRVREMIVTSDAIVTEGKVALPIDWAEAELIRFTGGKPLIYIPHNDFYGADEKRTNWYTLLGNDIEFGSPIDEIEGLEVTMSYYQHIPTFTDDATWLFSKYYNIYLQSCNAAAALYSQEFERATSLEGFVSTMVEAANGMFRRGNISGSVLRRPPPARIG